MNRRSLDTQKQIMEAALTIIKGSGVEGLSMRKVASMAGKSLNNVQHHFTNKQKLLASLADFYFAACVESVEQYVPSSEALAPQEALYEFVCFVLDQSDHITDTCLVFRELWATSTRHQAIEDKLNAFYAAAIERACHLWQAYGRPNAERAASLLLPFIDGYSIQHKALPITKPALATLLTDTLYRVLTETVVAD